MTPTHVESCRFQVPKLLQHSDLMPRCSAWLPGCRNAAGDPAKVTQMEPLHFRRATLPFKRHKSFFFLTSQYQKKESLQAIPSHLRSAVSPEPGGLGHPVVFPSGNIRPVVGAQLVF